MPVEGCDKFIEGKLLGCMHTAGEQMEMFSYHGKGCQWKGEEEEAEEVDTAGEQMQVSGYWGVTDHNPRGKRGRSCLLYTSRCV